MRKIILFATFLYSSILFAQTEKEIWFMQDFQISMGFSNLMPNKSMMGDAHATALPVVYGRLGVFHFNQFSIGLHANVARMDVKDTQYYGDFDKTTYFTFGPYISFFQPASSDIALQPYLSYDYSEYSTKFRYKRLDYSSNGLGIGMDFHYKAGEHSFFTFGLKYNINTLDTQAHPNWDKYLNNHHYFSAKIGFNFAKNRL